MSSPPVLSPREVSNPGEPSLRVIDSMETSHQYFSNDSFSYNWLMNITSPLDSAGDALRLSLDTQNGGSSFIEMDPKLFSKRWKNKTADSLDFDFHLPSPQSAAALVHADQIMCDGLLLPLHLVHPPKTESISASPSNSLLLRSLSIDSSKSLLSLSNRFGSRCISAALRRPTSLNTSPVCSPLQSLPASSSSAGSSKSEFGTSRKNKLPLFGGSASSSKKFFQKYLCLLLPFCKKVKGLVSARKAKRSIISSAASCMESTGSSPRHSDAFVSCELYRGKAVVDAGTETAIYDAVLHCKNSFGKS